MRAVHLPLNSLSTTLKKKKMVKLISVIYFILPDISKLLSFQHVIFYILLFTLNLQNPVYIGLVIFKVLKKRYKASDHHTGQHQYRGNIRRSFGINKDLDLNSSSITH